MLSDIRVHVEGLFPFYSVVSVRSGRLCSHLSGRLCSHFKRFLLGTCSDAAVFYTNGFVAGYSVLSSFGGGRMRRTADWSRRTLVRRAYPVAGGRGFDPLGRGQFSR